MYQLRVESRVSGVSIHWRFCICVHLFGLRSERKSVSIITPTMFALEAVNPHFRSQSLETLVSLSSRGCVYKTIAFSLQVHACIQATPITIHLTFQLKPYQTSTPFNLTLLKPPSHQPPLFPSPPHASSPLVNTTSLASPSCR